MSTEQKAFELSEVDAEGLKKLGDIRAGVAPLQFIRLEDSDFFWTQVAIEDDDLIFQMFPTVDPQDERWRKQLPAVLDPFAQSFFQARFPQLQAAYIPEKDSWWFRSNDVRVLDKMAYAQRFISKLNVALRPQSPHTPS